MKLTNAQIANSAQPLARLMMQPLSLTISFKLKKLKKELVPLLDIINESINEVNEKFTVKGADGQPEKVFDQKGNVVTGAFVITKEGVEERKKLDVVENEVSIEPIKISDLPKDVLISETDLEALEWLLVE